MLYLGVDGGMTKTIALVCGADGRISGHARAGGSDVYSVTDPTTAIDEIVRAASGAIEGGRRRARLRVLLAVGGRLAGRIAFYASELSRRVPARRTVVVNDAIGAIRSAAEDGIGCSLVIGTGTAIGARARDGRIWHMSFLAAPTFTTDLDARDARRRGAQRARPVAAEPAPGARGRGARRRRCLRGDRAADRPRPPSQALLPRRFSISGNGALGGTLSAGAVNSATQYNISGSPRIERRRAEQYVRGVGLGHNECGEQ